MQVPSIPAPSAIEGKRSAELLIVDDEEDIRSMLRRHFAYAGFAVSVATDGEDALARIAEKTPDIVITDINMPKMNGVELVKHLSATHPAVHVITITGYVSPSSIIRCMNYGAEACIFKPLQDLSELEEAVDEAVRSIVRWWHVLSELPNHKTA